jgi:hypothetical protein
MGMQSVGGVFLIAGAELSMGAQKWGGDGDVLSHGGQSDAWSLCLRPCPGNAAALLSWARVVMYGQRCGGECLGDGVGGLGRGVDCGAAWMTALGLEGDIGMWLDQDA